MISGYFVVLFSWFLLKMYTLPSSAWWIWNSCFYLFISIPPFHWKQKQPYQNNNNAPVLSLRHTSTRTQTPSHRIYKYAWYSKLETSKYLFIISETPFVGWASMGLRGIPGLKSMRLREIKDHLDSRQFALLIDILESGAFLGGESNSEDLIVVRTLTEDSKDYHAFSRFNFNSNTMNSRKLYPISPYFTPQISPVGRFEQQSMLRLQCFQLLWWQLELWMEDYCNRWAIYRTHPYP